MHDGSAGGGDDQLADVRLHSHTAHRQHIQETGFAWFLPRLPGVHRALLQPGHHKRSIRQTQVCGAGGDVGAIPEVSAVQGRVPRWRGGGQEGGTHTGPHCHPGHRPLPPHQYHGTKRTGIPARTSDERRDDALTTRRGAARADGFPVVHIRCSCEGSGDHRHIPLHQSKGVDAASVWAACVSRPSEHQGVGPQPGLQQQWQPGGLAAKP
mmetsp:Transcript_20695/g.50492  ORF Transcript_20695/g.50492 Transcript_20695/m.50492 type:complete len:210 (-) Transcript_20695:1018-1647(-)